MLEHIEKTKAQIWNERFEKRMNELKLSQRKFSALYKERFGTGSQADVSKWMHIGEIDSRSKKGRKFPEFETMRNIAEILEVSVGYLIGETDFKTYEMEQVSRYTGLSPTAIEATRAVTSGKAIPPFYKYPDSQRTAALELFLSNSMLVEYLKSICDLAEAMDREKKQPNYFERAVKKIPEPYRNAAVELWSDPDEAAEKGIKPTEELLAFADTLDDAACEDMRQPDVADREIKSAKYALQETHIKMIDEILSKGNVQKLLPHYATREEIKQLVGINIVENK